MNKNMEQAKNALQAELAHAKLGIEYWTTKVNQLRDMIAKIDNLEQEPVAKKTEKIIRPGKKKALPATGRDFWINQFTVVPESSAMILVKAIQNLGIAATADTKKRIAARLATAIQILTKDGTVIAHGEGKRRTFTISKGR